jgi:DNA-binding NarL/FixJ family response regulator
MRRTAQRRAPAPRAPLPGARRARSAGDMMSTPVRLLLVDDHAILRRGMGLLIAREPDLEIVGEAGTIAEALEAAASAAPDVAILDVHLPDGSGIGAIGPLRELRPALGVVMLSMYDDFDHVRRAFAEGADAYVVKSSTQDDLLTAVRTVAAGGTYRDPSLPSPDGPHQVRRPIDTLSPRELEVLRLLALGNTNHEIADALVVSVKTVETHRAHIMSKLKADSRAALVQHALGAGLLGPD